ESFGQEEQRVVGAEDLAFFADDVDVVGVVREGEGPAREDFADGAVGEADLHAGGVFAFDGLDESAHRALDFYRGRAGEIEQAVARVISGVDELSAALGFEVRAPTSFE